MAVKRKYYNIKSKNNVDESHSTTINKKISKINVDSDDILSDFDDDFCRVSNNNKDVYSQWMEWVKKDTKYNETSPSLKENKIEDNKMLNDNSKDIKSDNIILDTELLLDNNTELDLGTNDNTKQKDYFIDYTNEGMLSIPELKNSEKDINDRNCNLVNLPGFVPYKLDKIAKTERMDEIQSALNSYKYSGPKLTLKNYYMDLKVRKNWEKELNTLTNLNKYEQEQLNTFYCCLNSYLDIEYSDLKGLISEWTISLSALHIVKHIYSSRNLVMSNNVKLQQSLNDKENSKIDFLGEDKFRDQGFNRCRILILCPFKGLAKDFLDKLINILPHGKVLRGYDRFNDEFGISENSDLESSDNKNNSSTGIEGEIGKQDQLYKYLFENKNNDDEFKLGLQLTKSGINLYSSFDNSDVIIASPLGLRRMIGMNKDENKSLEYLFCSSIEICLVYGADIIYMQNWDHLLDIFKIMNKLPKKSLGNCDIRRVYQSFLDDKSREFRQTIFISSCRREDISSLFRNYTFNRRGFIRLWNPIEKTMNFTEYNLPIYKAPKLVNKIEQMFIKIGVSGNPEDCLINYFSSTLYPDILAAVNGVNQRVLIVLSNYVTYLRIKKYLIQQNAIFGSCHESSPNSSLSRNRLAFYKGDLPILITTERFLFFRRYLLKGATKVIFCSPPLYPSIYLDCINSINYSKINDQNDFKDSNPLVITLFHLHNSLALERIVGTSKCSNLIQNSKILKPTIIKVSN